MRWPDWFGHRARRELALALEGERRETVRRVQAQDLADAMEALARSAEGINSRLVSLIETHEKRVRELEHQIGTEQRIWRYASDAAIAEWAKASDDEKVAEISRLTRMLARESARCMELGTANSELVRRIKSLTQPDRKTTEQQLREVQRL